MIVCPLCEHQQASGEACDVCGKRLLEAGATPDVVAPMPELERTALGSADVAIAPMLEIEGHRFAASTEEVSVLDAAGLPADPDEERTDTGPNPLDASAAPALPETVTCRYCGKAQPRTNRFCEGCGFALPVWGRRRSPDDSEAKVACPSCGLPGAPGGLCHGCGCRLRASEER